MVPAVFQCESNDQNIPWGGGRGKALDTVPLRRVIFLSLPKTTITAKLHGLPSKNIFFFIQFPMDKIKSYSSSGRVDANQKANRIKLAWVGWMGLGTQ